jgi:signal transduction histidine kinase
LQAANLFFGQLVRAQDPDRRERAADGVRKAFDAAEQLLSHMLNHLRLEADAVQPQLAPVSLNDVLSRLVIQFGPLAEAQGVRLRHVPTRKRLVTDRVLLERALGNLVDNALRHSGAKRLLLGVRSIDPARIWIIDDGVGISPSEQDRIFEDYFRGSDSRAVTKVGFGLGLASVRRIAQLLGGECAVDPRWTKGAAFKLELPAGKAKP